MSNERIAEALQVERVQLTPLAGGCIADVRRVEAPDGRSFVAKIGGGALDIEGAMLVALREPGVAPVPEVVWVEADLLIMEFMSGSTGCRAAAELHAADTLAALHAVSGPRFGWERDTLIGPLHQPNPASDRFLPFFAESRLVYMAKAASDAGQLPVDLCRQVERLAGRLERYVAEPLAPALLHGDLWSGNVLSEGDRLTGLIDPAVYWGHPEVDLAFSTLFGTFSDGFYDRYVERSGLELGEDFFQVRRHIWNLWPLLVHVRLFGGGYVDDVRRILKTYR